MLRIDSADYIKDYLMWLEFDNGVKGVADFAPIVNKPRFSFLKDESNFIKYGLLDTVYWRVRDKEQHIQDELDLAPEYILEKLMILKNTNNHEHYNFGAK